MFAFKKKLPFTIYIISTVLSILAWGLFGTELCDFLGASSLIYSLILSVTAEFRWVAYLSLIWIVALFLSLTVTFLILCKKCLFRPMIFVIGADLCFSLLCLIYKCVVSNYASFTTMLLGLIFRTLYYLYLIYHSRREHR